MPIGGAAVKITKLPVHDKPAALAWIRAHRLTGLGILQMFHDDTCRAVQTQCDADCCCVPDIALIEPFRASPAQEKAVSN